MDIVKIIVFIVCFCVALLVSVQMIYDVNSTHNYTIHNYTIVKLINDKDTIYVYYTIPEFKTNEVYIKTFEPKYNTHIFISTETKLIRTKINPLQYVYELYWDGKEIK